MKIMMVMMMVVILMKMGMYGDEMIWMHCDCDNDDACVVWSNNNIPVLYSMKV